MNREERARRYANIVPIPFAPNNVTKIITDGLVQAYLAGAKYADATPAWRMCEDEMPSKKDDYIILDKDKEVYLCYWNGSEWIGSKVIAWLPLPKFNLKSE